ncbi:hypothetical protein L198_06109 [Cryptococcus wingfieldii CBS 7118]|uniref:Uncharacterized protein n=1 Tax=Cryptococcus wingfieldii CBS 7118 TaxID=1295528 RepID=A0A1E3IQD0_9TREE|nr:hypothetical protein L198_06109 [Cryptococcus wingfieldii CBS 7118]ODN90792.1 hypothetical protein L198_06109 [Cryptococcus wingfieldii CBS 7118]
MAEILSYLFLSGTGAGAYLTTLAAGTGSYLLSLAGFGQAGVTSGSLAAWFQSYFLGGYIAQGSWFAYLQSVGAGGLPVLSWCQSAFLGSFTGFLTYLGWGWKEPEPEWGWFSPVVNSWRAYWYP